MPSGAKKRKAARKKKEMAVPHAPDSPTDLPHGNGERDSGSEEEGEPGMDSHGVEETENGAGDQQRVEKKDGGDVSVEFEETLVPVVQASSVNEEVVEAIEGLAEQAEVTVERSVERTVAKESEEVMEVAAIENISERPPESGEKLPEIESGGEVMVEDVPEKISGPTETSEVVVEDVPEMISVPPLKGGERLCEMETPEVMVEAVSEKISEPPSESGGRLHENESAEVMVVAVPEKISETPSESGGRLLETKSRGIPDSTEVVPAPLVVHRATLWNCCGLLDALSGSQR